LKSGRIVSDRRGQAPVSANVPVSFDVLDQRMAKSRKPNSTAKSLVIVESPAKARTISKYLGKGYVVKASMGHVRDLPERSLAIDVEKSFEPTYEVVRGRKRLVGELSKAADKAESVYLATDLDREGEAIAWHLVEALDLPATKVRRVVFNEITKSAIRQAFEHPRRIDVDKVNAQQARRILDRIVGYELSPLLWKKIAKGLSAGRVQSVAVRLIVEREDEIRAFIPSESWRITVQLTVDSDRAGALASQWRAFLTGPDTPQGGRKQREQLEWLASHDSFRAELISLGGNDFKPEGCYDASAPSDKAFRSAVDEALRAAEAIGFACTDRRDEIWDAYKHRGLHLIELIGHLEAAKSGPFRVVDVQTRRVTSKPQPPFTTAALQQAAANQLSFATSRTMRIAQQLYEGIDLRNGDGPVGLITYMRTDSTNLSKESVEVARAFIRDECGDRYVPAKPSVYASGERAQEAHEAIRPTDMARTPASLRAHLSAEQYKLYDLIWRRFVVCQMTPAEWDSTTVLIDTETAAGPARFKATGRVLVFDGFYRIAGMPKGGDEPVLPKLETGQSVGAFDLRPTQHFSSPPPRYTEASLVKALESEGIGRPSTYAAIVQTIQDRGYVEQSDRRFYATDKGEVVTKKLIEHFPEVMDVKFTSYMEQELDKIEESHLDWVRVLHEFYDPFHRSLNKAHDDMEAARAEPSKHTCPECNRPMVYRWSKTGRFLSCSGYPECKTAFNVDRNGDPIIPKEVDVTCERCGRPMVLRRSRNGPFLGCSGYPECTGTIPCDEHGVPLKLVKEEDLKEPCDQCGVGQMIVKRKGRRAFLGCNNFPACKNTKSLPKGVRLAQKPQAPPEEAGFACEKCGKPMVIRTGRRGKFISCSGFPRCRNTKPFEKLEELRAAAAQRPAQAAATDASAVPWDDDETATEAAPTAAGKKRGPGSAKKSRTTHKAATSSTEHAAAKSKTKAKAKAKPADVSDEFIALAESKGFGVTRYGNLYADELRDDFTCPHCGSPMSLKRGRFGPFLSCEAFPNCRTMARLRNAAMEQAKAQLGEPDKKPPPEPTDIQCDQCGAKMVIRTGRSGKFLGCSAYPKCRNTKPIPTDMLSLGTK
jgi:DNA topoisomerase-1